MDDPFVVGQHVVVRNAWNQLVPATIVPVPRDWRSRRGPYAGSTVVTSRGKFVKVWVRLRRGTVDSPPTPWPLDDVLTELPADWRERVQVPQVVHAHRAQAVGLAEPRPRQRHPVRPPRHPAARLVAEHPRRRPQPDVRRSRVRLGPGPVRGEERQRALVEVQQNVDLTTVLGQHYWSLVKKGLI